MPRPRSERFAGCCACDGWRDRCRITGERHAVLVDRREPAPDRSAEQQSQWVSSRVARTVRGQQLWQQRRGTHLRGALERDLLSVVASFAPTGSTFSQLLAISCPGASNRFAVGSWRGSSSGKTPVAVERTRWAVVPSPSPAGPVDSELVGVSCSSATSCFAVGDDSSSSGAVTLVERWDGTNGTIVASPNPSGAPHSQLVGVSCVSATSCFAVGSSYAFSNSKTSLLEQWDGTAWSIVSAPNPSGTTDSQLSGVSCASVTTRLAVAPTHPDHKSLVERGTGRAGRTFQARTPGNTAQSAGRCVVHERNELFRRRVLRHDLDRDTLAASDGTTWSTVPSPNAGATDPNQPSAVSCTSATSCFAVGYYATGNPEPSHSWSAGTEPAGRSALPGLGIAEPAERCHAPAPQAVSPSGTTPRPRPSTHSTARWDGTTWSTVAIPNPAGTDNQPSGVSCTSATSCFRRRQLPTFLRQHTVGGAVERTNCRSIPASSVAGGELSSVPCTSLTN